MMLDDIFLFNTKIIPIVTISIIFSFFSRGSIVADAKLYIINMNNKKRLQLCDIADGLLADASSANITTQTITNLKIQNLGKI